MIETHITGTYKLISKEKYKLIPELGLNYRFHKWTGKMNPPLDEFPIRRGTIEFRDGFFIITSTKGQDYKEKKINDIGLTIRTQNQFFISNSIYLNVTPFIEMDYDRTQRNGGSYFGITKYLN